MVFFIVFIIYILLYLVSIRLKDNSIVDIFWWIGFVIIWTYFFYISWNYNILHIILFVLICFWWVRLSYHILKRKLKEKKEDPRYALWRKRWKYFYTRSFFQVYMLQMLLMFIIATPLYFIFLNENKLIFISWLIISIIWLTIEIIADNQLKNNIKKDNKVYTWWLYRYSRNPNYFWESLFWLGISFIWAFVNIFSLIWFIMITFLLLFVSWVPMKEKRLSRKSNWESYKLQTNKFIPWFPKKNLN